MNAAHVHLMVNHLPLFAALFGAALLLFGVVRGQEVVTRIGLVLAVLAGVGAFAAARSGEGAEEIVEEYAGVSESAIHDHEEAGEAAQWASLLLGVLALTALVVPAQRVSLKKAATYGSVLMSLVAFGLIARAANLGGEIRHPEISGAAPSADVEEEHGSEEEHGDEDDA